MEQHNRDIANNLIAIIHSRSTDDPMQIDDELFKHHIVNGLFPEYKRTYGKELKYGPYEEIIKQIETNM